MRTTISDPETLRVISDDPDFHNEELYPSKANGHKFLPGEMRTLAGLVDFHEFNGQKVKVTDIRMDGPHGKAYYIEGEINKFVNWVYEYRLI